MGHWLCVPGFRRVCSCRGADDAIARFAQQNGYDLILPKDDAIDVPENVSNADYLKAATSRRMYFSSEAANVSDQLITFMNNEYQTRRSAG